MICGNKKFLSKVIGTIGTIETIETSLTNFKNSWCTQIHQLISTDKVTIAILPTYPAVSHINYSTLITI